MATSAPTEAELNEMTVAKLKDLGKSLGLPVKGRKVPQTALGSQTFSATPARPAILLHRFIHLCALCAVCLVTFTRVRFLALCFYTSFLRRK